MFVVDSGKLRRASKPERRRPPYFKTKKLAILGSTNTVHLAPWTDPSWTLASHICTRRLCQREPDWYFDLHRPECFRLKHSWRDYDHYSFLKTSQTPIFMQDEYPDVPMAVRFPKERILAEFRPFFANQVAWMIALAIIEGVHTIGLFGCEYGGALERTLQRGSAQFWLGYFEGRGGNVVLPWASRILADPEPLYGYESHDKHGRLIPAYRLPPPTPMPSPAVDTPQLKVFTPQAVVADIGEAPCWERFTRLFGQKAPAC